VSPTSIESTLKFHSPASDKVSRTSPGLEVQPARTRQKYKKFLMLEYFVASLILAIILQGIPHGPEILRRYIFLDIMHRGEDKSSLFLSFIGGIRHC